MVLHAAVRGTMRQLHLKDPQLWSYRQSPCPPLTPARTVLDTIASIDLDSPSSSQWSQCTQMPSEIHVELLARGVIPDPFKGRAEEVRIVSTPTSEPHADPNTDRAVGRRVGLDI